MSEILPNRYPEVLTKTKIKPYNEVLCARIKDHLKNNELSQEDFANQLGISGTAVSRYISGKFEGNVTKFEERAEDVLRNASLRKDNAVSLFVTPIYITINAAIESLRKTNEVGIITGPAGIGKSCGVRLFCRENPVAMLIDCKAWCKSGLDLERALFDAVDPRKYDFKVKRSVFLVQRFAGSNRPIIFDNAQRLRSSGFAFAFDFHDSTGVPMIFVGNPEIETYIKTNDQYHSRLGRTVPLSTTNKEAQSIAAEIIHRVAPEFISILPLATVVVQNKGQARALRKQLRLAQELAAGEDFRDLSTPETLHEDAFRVAHTKLIRDYKLPE